MDPHKTRFVVTLLAYAAQRGLSPEQLCHLSGIDFHAIRNGSPSRITKKNLNDLWANTVHISKDELFGLHFGESLQLAALGVIGQIIQHSNTIGQALTIGAGHAGLVYDEFSMKINRRRNSFEIQVVQSPESTPGSSIALQQMRDFLMVFLLHELDGLLFTTINPTTVTLSKANRTERPSAHVLHEYERVFRCKPRITESTCAIELPLNYWNEPIITANHELQNILIRKATEEGHVNWDHVPTLKEKVLKYLGENSYLDLLTLEKVAANLNMSTRTLQRKLSEEGCTFQQLADEARKDLAMHYIKLGYPSKEISRFLGYNEISAFSRALKRWTRKRSKTV